MGHITAINLYEICQTENNELVWTVTTKRIGAGILLCATALAGCAQKSDSIEAMYFSPTGYESYSCRQLSEEAQRVSAHAAHAAGVQDQKATSDAVATGVALVLFWPAAFFIQGDDTNATALAQLKGQMNAIQEVSRRKGCNIQFQTAPAVTSASATAPAKPSNGDDYWNNL